jgi:hypothetical protein
LLLVEYLIREAFLPINRQEIPNIQHSVSNNRMVINE